MKGAAGTLVSDTTLRCLYPSIRKGTQSARGYRRKKRAKGRYRARTYLLKAVMQWDRVHALIGEAIRSGTASRSEGRDDP